jgi:hypothetical protein
MAVIAVFVLTTVVSGTDLSTTEAVFPGTNGRIAFIDTTGGADSRLTLMNPDGSARTEIGTSLTEREPAFGSDGRTVFFRGLDSFLDDGLYFTDGVSPPTRIPNTQGNFFGPAPSPDGQWVAFQHAPSPGPGDIWAIGMDGTGFTNLTNTADGDEFSPDWSPDGQQIAYVRAEVGTCCGSDIWIMDADGDNKRQVTNSPDVYKGYLDWSPDGTQIIFDWFEEMSVAGSLAPGEIAVINADGSGFQMITNDSTLSQSDPAFSPDGNRIVYVGVPVGVSVSTAFGSAIFVANSDGSNPVNISPPGASDTSPDWGLDQPATLAVWGDANCSGGADPVDSLLTLRHDAGLSTNTGNCPAFGTEVDVAFASLHLWGDVDCNDAVTPVDSLKLLRFDAGLSVAQEPDCPPIGSDVQILVP